MNLDKMVKTLIDAVKQSEKKGTTPYDTTAEVIRIDGDTAWVHIAGGVEETPVKLTINAVKGDIVQVRVSGGSAWLTGNSSKPPTDDSSAKKAQSTANDARKRAMKAQTTADDATDIATRAQTSANGKNTIYYDASRPTGGGFKVGDTWFNSSEDNAIYTWNGTTWVKEELGENAIAELSIKTAHIQDGAITNAKVGNLDAGKITSGTINTNLLDVSGIISVGGIATDSDVASAKSDAEQVATNFLSHDGTNGTVLGHSGLSSKVQLKSTGLYLYDGSGNIGTSIEASRVKVGRSGVGYVDILSSGIDMYAGSSNVNLAHIGYDVGNNESGSTSTDKKPYFTFGTRRSNSTIGNWSIAVGSGNIASGAFSFAEGGWCSATGVFSYAGGTWANATGNYSFARGHHVDANYDYQTVIGKNSVAGNYALIIGNGGSQLSTSNALTVDWNGNINANSFSGRSVYLGASESLKGYFNSTNEFNFIGSDNSQTTLYIGYRNNTPHISNYIFCNSTGSTNGRGNVYCNHLYASGDVQVPNMSSFRSYKYQDSSTLVTLLYLNTSNVCTFGTTAYVSRINGSSISSSTTISGSSDIRLKKDIEKIGQDTDKVLLGLEPISFNWKDKEEHDGERHYGISAQQLMEKLKEQNISLENLHLVKEIEGYYGVAYTEFIPMLIHLCQSQQREIDELKEKVQ